MNILLIYPKYPNTFWSFKYALRFIRKGASYPPLGLLTVAALLPEEWNLRLVDLNTRRLRKNHINWADYVFISAMSIQDQSVRDIVKVCQEAGKKIVAGGPLFSANPDKYPLIDHLVLDEAEHTLPKFLKDLKAGKAKRIYRSEDKPDIRKTPIPRWDLINMKDYASMNIQYSRGCPFNCEFCDIVSLYGRSPRTKTKDQVIRELDALYNRGWRGGGFFVDDNFIGNKKKLKEEILPAIRTWMQDHKYPFTFTTEASVNMADDDDLMESMVRAGFRSVFLGIESPNEASLAECNKTQNINRDLLASIKKIQDKGMMVHGGFIVGFDSDHPGVFEGLIRFIEESGIIVAMVGLLNAPRGTKLYKRLEKEKRLVKNMTGDNTDLSMNFIPKLDYRLLINGYKRVVASIYTPKAYYKRVINFLKDFNPGKGPSFRLDLAYVGALLKSILVLGALGKERIYFWKLFFWSLFRRPRLFPMAITYAIYGFHFRKIFKT